ncbi:MAG: sodium transport system permease protein, partial [Alteromonadaceae bacterium]
MIQFKALLTKELKEALRDRRALMMALSFAVMAPIIIFAMSKVMISKITETPEVYIKINGAEFAPKLIKHLKDENILSFKRVPDDEKIMWDERDVILTIPKT